MVVWALLGMASEVTLLCSSAAAKHFSTWLWRQVYLPLVRLVLLTTWMCLRVAGASHWTQAGSSPNHRCRFVGDGGTSQVALMMKLSQFDSMFY